MIVFSLYYLFKSYFKSIILGTLVGIAIFSFHSNAFAANTETSAKNSAFTNPSSTTSPSANQNTTPKTAVLLEVKGAIGPATQDYLERGIAKAEKENATLVIIRMDTPGGLDTSMRGITKAILASKVPVATYVAPSGARAASAGTFILYASHIAAMAPGTNLGAASPVSIGGGGLSPTDSDEKASNAKDTKQKQQSTMEKKVTHDAVAYIRGLAALQGRNADWAETAVTAAVSLPAEEAYKLKVIDLIADNMSSLLNKINGRTVKLQGLPKPLETENIIVKEYFPDWRNNFLSIITDPNIAYILLLIGIYGLFFEFSNPGFILPGVAGAIGLLLALYAFQLLPINYAGFALLLLGIVFMVIEAYMPSFGALGIGGVISFVVGSIFLLETDSPTYGISWTVILLMAVITTSFFFVLINLTIRSFKKTVVTGSETLIGTEGIVLQTNAGQIFVQIQSEIWKAHSEKPLEPGQTIRVTKVNGLLLTVEPVQKSTFPNSGEPIDNPRIK